MCERSKDEPLLRYWFRQFKEEPLRVMMLVALGGLCYLYQDNRADAAEARADMKEQNAALIGQLQASTQAMSEIASQLRVMDGRLQHLEREHELTRKNQQ